MHKDGLVSRWAPPRRDSSGATAEGTSEGEEIDVSRIGIEDFKFVLESYESVFRYKEQIWNDQGKQAQLTCPGTR